jgi:hypothetical protein
MVPRIRRRSRGPGLGSEVAAPQAGIEPTPPLWSFPRGAPYPFRPMILRSAGVNNVRTGPAQQPRGINDHPPALRLPQAGARQLQAQPLELVGTDNHPPGLPHINK